MDWGILKLREGRGNTDTGHKLVLGLVFREPQRLQLQGLEKVYQGQHNTAQTLISTSI